MKNNKFAFTLAEVLITLGIIGVVAAMTLPTLIQNHQKKVTVVRLKKFYSVMSNAIRMEEAALGDYKGWAPTQQDDFVQWFDEHIIKHIKVTSSGRTNDYIPYYATFSDGSGFTSYLGTGNTIIIFYYIFCPLY